MVSDTGLVLSINIMCYIFKLGHMVYLSSLKGPFNVFFFMKLHTLWKTETSVYTGKCNQLVNRNGLYLTSEYVAHLSFHYVKFNKGRLRCTEIICKYELISDVSYQNVT